MLNMFKKVNLNFADARASSLHTMTNVLCRIYEIVAAKRFNISHHIWYKNVKSVEYLKYSNTVEIMVKFFHETYFLSSKLNLVIFYQYFALK